jgi:UDP-N-acetylmuramate dehydrogenase
MNAGGHGSDTATWLLDAEILDGATGTVTRRTAADLDLSYRHSNLTPAEIVLAARFRTIAQETDTGRHQLREITQWRKEHQPGGTLNAGSVFKNPSGDSAGRLIDSAGLKGFRSGGVAVSERHANFFVAGEGASAQDVYDLVTQVRRKVAEAAGVWLEPEIRFVGEFDQSNPAEGAGGGRPG